MNVMHYCASVIGLYFVLLFAITCHVSGGQVSKQFKKQETPEGALQLTGYIKRQPVTRLKQCAGQCTHDDACFDFYYISEENICLLRDVNEQNVYSIQASQAVHYEHITGVYLECPVNNGGWAKARLQDGALYLFRLFTSTAVSQAQAVEYCQSIGSYPLRILTAEKMDFVQNNLTHCLGVSGQNFWVDGTNAEAANYSASDTYTTTENQIVPVNTNVLWGSSKGPNDNANEPRCIWIANRFSYYFDDVPCTFSGVKYICEKQLV
ncbi:uncharacterized protein LOC128549494 [Mercenaria mercenaria]|uniref:uncharacterized protein LOC128549494 n=1 Tax=Mercenaria mercenaria TaxID=6596 RepID=UPI00234E3899|nr:uncharacterized protein LOC128549494 [Mercenaria mercenaria]